MEFQYLPRHPVGYRGKIPIAWETAQEKALRRIGCFKKTPWTFN
jgi:hypothetical protein